MEHEKNYTEWLRRYHNRHRILRNVLLFVMVLMLIVFALLFVMVSILIIFASIEAMMKI